MRVKEKGDQGQIILFAMISDCRCCKERIETGLMKFGVWEWVEVGYESMDGTPVVLAYDKGKFPEVDFWEYGKKAKEWLNRRCYHVI